MNPRAYKTRFGDACHGRVQPALYEKKLTYLRSDVLLRVFTTVLQCYTESTCNQASLCRLCQEATLCRCRQRRHRDLLCGKNCIHSSYRCRSVLIVTQQREQISRAKSNGYTGLHKVSGLLTGLFGVCPAPSAAARFRKNPAASWTARGPVQPRAVSCTSMSRDSQD